MHTHNKRKQAVAGLPNSGRTVKRRASKACHCCRSRKVRCDVVESGIPCTNCRLDEVECIVTEGKRRRKSSAAGEVYQYSRHSPCASIEEEPDVATFPVFEDIDGLQELGISLDGMSTADSNLICSPNSRHQPHMLYQTQGHRLSQEERSRRLSEIHTTSRSVSTPQSAGSQHRRVSSEQHHWPSITLPRYLQSVPSRLAREDVDYLSRKGVFAIPEVTLRNELLRSYVQFVHPYLPVLDLEDFLSAIERDHPKNTISLLLLQAVLFAGSAYVDMRFLASQGYEDRKSARKALFQKVKLLYDFDYELDRVTIIQALLLMTYWYENPEDPKDVWHWLGIAISTAQTIGINCDSSDTGMPPKVRKLWKRIWWCCFMRDRLVSLGMRRPMRISNEHYSVEMLDLEDFETNAMPVGVSRMLGSCPVARDPSKRATLAQMCVSLVKLCHCISEVLTVQYLISGHRLGATVETTARLVPRKIATDPSDVLRCDRQLDQWKQNQPLELHYFIGDTQERTSTHDGDVINLHRALLTGLYLTTISALHRPQIIPSAPGTNMETDLQELSLKKVHQAADDITEIYRDLTARDLVRYLPTTGVTTVLPAIIVHMLDIKSSNVNTQIGSLRKFQYCMQALQRLREMYGSADFAFTLLDAAMHRTELHMNSTSSTRQSSVSTKATSTDTQRTKKEEVLLTPPPEASETAKRLLFACSLAPEERKLLEAFTPPLSDHSLNYVLGGNTTVCPSTQHHFKGINGNDSEHEFAPIQDREIQEYENAQNDFDSLVNLESGNDLFSPDEGLYSDLNMAWLHGMSDNP